MAHQNNKPKPIFISYRHDDTTSITTHIYERLNKRFKGKVFMDVHERKDGSDFPQRLIFNLQGCSVVLVVIGKNWLSITDPRDKELPIGEKDYVRWEVRTALRHKIRIIVLLVEGAQLPPKDQLPPELKKLRYKDIIKVRGGKDFEHDIWEVLTSLENILYGRLHRAVRSLYFKYEHPIWVIGGAVLMAMSLLMFNLIITQNLDYIGLEKFAKQLLGDR